MHFRHWLIIMLIMLLSFSGAFAQSEFTPGDKVIFVARSSPVYTDATATETNVGEVSRGTLSRILAIDEATQRVYLSASVYGWVDAIIDGEPSYLPFDENTVRQIEDEALSAINTNPSDTTAYVTAAMVANHTNRNSVALDLLSQALEIAPNDGYLLYKRGGVYLDMYFWEDAINDLEIAAQSYSIANVYNRLWNGYKGLGEFSTAIDKITQAIEIAPKWGLLLNNLSAQYFDMGDYASTIELATTALLLDPLMIHAYYNRGLALMNRGETDAALDDVNMAVQIDPGDSFAYIRRAFIYNRGLGDYARALEDFDAAIAVEPQNPAIYSDRGVMHFRYGARELAITDLKHALDLNPLDVYIRYNLANFYSRTGYFAEALEQYDLTVEVSDRFDYSVLLYRPQVLIALEQYDAALEDITNFIAGEPSEYFEITARIQRAAIYAHQGEYMRSQSDLSIAQRTNSEFTNNFYYYGQEYRVMDSQIQTLEDLQSELLADPNNTETLLQTGKLAIQLGVWDIAYDCYARYDAIKRVDDINYQLFLSVIKNLYT